MSSICISKITVEFTVGMIGDVIIAMKALAEQFKCPVTTMFNDTLLDIQPNEDPMIAISRWVTRKKIVL